jgi:hypothetical protein
MENKEMIVVDFLVLFTGFPEEVGRGEREVAR